MLQFLIFRFEYLKLEERLSELMEKKKRFQEKPKQALIKFQQEYHQLVMRENDLNSEKSLLFSNLHQNINDKQNLKKEQKKFEEEGDNIRFRIERNQ